MNRSAWQIDLLPELGELASQLAHPMHDRLAAGSEPAACEADRVTQLPECSAVVEGFPLGVAQAFRFRVAASRLSLADSVGRRGLPLRAKAVPGVTGVLSGMCGSQASG